MDNYVLENGKKFFIHPVFKKYAANEDGEIMNVRLRNVKKGNLGNSGYLLFTIRLNKNKCKSYLSHRFVFECFYKTIEKNKQINHINFIKTDNRIKNLESISASENCKKSAIFRDYSFVKNNYKNRKSVTAINLETKKEINFNSLSSVYKMLGIYASLVKNICEGKKYHKSATSKIDGQKYTFRYLN